MNKTASMKILKARSHGGYTLVETVIAAALSLILVGVASIAAMQSISMIKRAREHAAAAHGLQERVEMLRSMAWDQITNINDIVSSDFFGTNIGNLHLIPPIVEQVTITEWPPPPTGTPPYIQATKTKSGISVVQDDRVFSARAVEVDLALTWVTTGNTTLSYATKAIISKGGVTR